MSDSNSLDNNNSVNNNLDNSIKNTTNSEIIENLTKIERTVDDKNAPYSNISVWVSSFFFWPIAWWILSYISLKRLWYDYAKYVLIWTIIWTIWLAYIIMFILPENSGLKIWFLWPIIFIALQNKQVSKWEKENKNKKFNSWLKAFAWWILWLFLFIIMAFLVAIVFISS